MPTIHRGMGQIMPTARRVMFASLLLAQPVLQEPLFLVDISVPQDAMGGCYGVLTRRRGVVFSEEQRPGTPMVFSHWAVLQGDPTDLASKPGAVIGQVRKRKGLNPEIPPLDRFLDRL